MSPRNQHNSAILRALLAAAGGVVVASAALIFFNHAAVALGVTVSGAPLNHLTLEEAERALSEQAAAYERAALALRMDDHVWGTTPKALGVSLDWRQTAHAAWSVGRGGNAVTNALTQITVALAGKEVLWTAHIDDELLNLYLAANLNEKERKARNASLLYDERYGTFSVTPEEEGYVIDASKLKYDLLSAAAGTRTPEISLRTVRDVPFVKQAMAEPVAREANKLLSQAPFALAVPELKTFSSTVERGQLKDLLTVGRNGEEVVLDVNPDALSILLAQLAPAVNRKPSNAVLTVRDGRAIEFTLSQNGLELDIQQNTAIVREGLLAGSKVIPLATQAILPEVRTETIENLGLVALLGTGESDFAGSPSGRIFNIKLGAHKLNGILIRPGEEFSFMNNIGEISAKEGWRDALVIKGKNLIPEFGGGLCQVSTTMFRAAVWSGLPITERYPHSLPVVYYNPQGFDAAVYDPHPDLRFVNDTPSNILVQTRVEGTKLYFEFYGTPDGRGVALDGPVEYERKPDGSLKTILTREIRKEGELVKKDVFRSSYRSPLAASVQRNPLE